MKVQRSTTTAILDDSSSSTVPLVEELSLDAWTAFRRLAGLRRVIFFDSAMPHETLGRYSFLTADPFEVLRSRRASFDPFKALEERLARFQTTPIPGLPPFQGGAAGLFGYDLCHHIEKLPRPRVNEFAVPDLAVGLYDWVIAFDHHSGRSWIISTGLPARQPQARRRRARRRLENVLQLLSGPEAERVLTGHRLEPAVSFPVPGLEPLTSSFDREGYLAAVRRAVEYIHAGDCFQVNIAQRLLCPLETSPLRIYEQLRQRNPATFSAYFDLGDFVLASASPERFLRVQEGQIETRPIKGTRPRGATAEEDRARLEELKRSAKDRAENVMIVDLLRNDLGRVCEYGSIRVSAVCRPETYRFVHHLVSVVEGRLREGKGPIDLLRAAFPGGSVTGAPKIRAMEIIAELEPTARGPYCGSLGYIGFDGNMDTNILIRTLTLGRGWTQFPVGGGIVADSIPEQEYQETWHKAEGLIRALQGV